MIGAYYANVDGEKNYEEAQKRIKKAMEKGLLNGDIKIY